MTSHAVLTAQTAEYLIQAGKLEMLPALFATVSIPADAQTALANCPDTAATAFKLPAGIVHRDTDQLEATAGRMLATGDISPDEAKALSLSKEMASHGVGEVVVLSENPKLHEHLYAEGPRTGVFVAGFWAVMCHAAGNHLVDLARERPELERKCPLDPDTRKRVDLFQNYQREQDLKHAQEQSQVH